MQVVRALSPHSIGVIKTIAGDADAQAAQLGSVEPEVCAGMLEQAGVAAILVGSHTPDNAGKPGCPADLALYRQVREATRIPVVLAGGVTPENVDSLLKNANPAWLDVMTGVEAAPGRKDAEKLNAMTAAVRTHSLEQGGTSADSIQVRRLPRSVSRDKSIL